MKLQQELYAAAAYASRERMAKALGTDATLAKLCLEAQALPPREWSLENDLVKRAGREYIKALMKAGVTTSLGFNFYDLRGPAYLIFPLNTPFIQMIPKTGKVNAGVGTVAHWKATLNPNSTFVYAGVKEGQRNATATPDEADYFATYKELGEEGGETFTAQWAGEGYTDNLADEHFRNLARLRLQEEMITLWGNAGPSTILGQTTGNLGFALGQPTTPTVDTGSAAGGLATGSNVSVAVVALTAMGVNPGGQAGYNIPPTVARGLTAYTERTNADGTKINVAGGISAISNVAMGTTNSSGSVLASLPAQKGAVAYAWYWGVNANTTVDVLTLGAITAWPNYTITAKATGIQTGNATGFTVDNSYQATDLDGLGTYTFNNGLCTDMGGGTFTPAGNGQVQEVEDDLRTLWELYQAQPDAIWCSADVRAALESAVIYSSTGTNSYIFQYTKDAQGSLMGGFLVTSYKSKYSINPEGGAAIPIRIHPMFPPGTMLYDINTNPYPHSRVPSVRQFLLQRDYYAIEWPIVTRQWTFGTYIHEVLAHYMPWISALRTGIGPFVKP
jgi:hypothetical protein